MIGVPHPPCEEIGASISFLKNASQNCCLTLRDHFVGVKRQQQSVRTSRDAIMIICRGEFDVCIELNMLSVKINGVSISFPENTS